MCTCPDVPHGPRPCSTGSSGCRRRSRRKTSGRSGVASSRKPLSPADITERLRAQFGDDILSFEEVQGHPVATVAPSRYAAVASFLRAEPALDFDFFDFLAAVYYRHKDRA